MLFRSNQVLFANEDGTLMYNIVYVAAGENFYVAIQDDGTVWTWGDNTSGQLGMYESASDVPKKRVIYSLDNGQNRLFEYIFALEYSNVPGADKPVNLTKYLQDKAAEVQKKNEEHDASAGENRDRYTYPTETVTLLPDVVAAAAGDHHTLLLGRDGSVWAFGDNTYGQLGTGDTENYYGRVVQVLKGAGTGFSTSEKDGKYLTDIIQIAADGNQSMALRADGTVWTWGENTRSEERRVGKEC